MKTLAAVIAILFLAIPAAVQAQQCRLLAMADELKLTDEQIEQITSNMTAQHKDMIQLEADLEKAKLEMRELMLAKKIDKNAVLMKSEAISQIKANMAKKRLAGQIDRLNLLTDQQRTMVRQQMMRNRPGMGRHRSFDRGGRQGWGMRYFNRAGMKGPAGWRRANPDNDDED
jgi:Spy/CpxP family protein refolding chaperone